MPFTLAYVSFYILKTSGCGGLQIVEEWQRNVTVICSVFSPTALYLSDILE
jgi:hypothetical protein